VSDAWDRAIADAQGTAWPLHSVLARLAEAGEHLLDEHDCDGHGHEEVRFAVDAARAMLATVAKTPTAPARSLAEIGRDAPLRLSDREGCQDWSASVMDRIGNLRGRLYCYVNALAFLSHQERTKASVDDSRWKCTRWMNETLSFIELDVLGSFSIELGISGTPVMIIGLTADTVSFFWEKSNARGVVLVQHESSRACGECLGCMARVVALDAHSAKWVYFIQSIMGGPIKIGRAHNPEKRIKDLQVSHPEKLRIIAVMPGHSAVERCLHRLFAADRVPNSREWFNPSKDLLAFIKEVGSKR
jgi:hypothetical protein